MKPRILVPFDFSATADAALAWAADLRAATGGPPLSIVHAISLRPFGSPEMMVDPIAPSPDELRGLERALGEAAQRHGAPAEELVIARVLAVEAIILDAARDLGAELIVMGTHGKTGVRRLIMGSVAEHVVRHADCPVVTVRGRH
jgi:nucleotide-binding universal stress UspA family protein